MRSRPAARCKPRCRSETTRPGWVGRSGSVKRSRRSSGLRRLPRISISDDDVFADDEHPPSAAVEELTLNCAVRWDVSVGLLHSRRRADKKATMAAFNAANSTSWWHHRDRGGCRRAQRFDDGDMDADRFGISQLHQLRGGSDVAPTRRLPVGDPRGRRFARRAAAGSCRQP